MRHPLLIEEEGSRHLLLGNEAIVRGALEAGVHVVTCYPGTPSSEVPDTFAELAPQTDRFRLEYSVNEKVAVEVGLGAALAGGLCLTTMKHVGVNVAADPLFTAAYVGVPGGFVLLSADDPACHSSQDEQDNRLYARFMHMPCFEPATAQEAKDMTRDALLLARELEQPVMLRTTTRVNHLRGSVTFGALPGPQPVKSFKRNPGRFVPIPAVARTRHPILREQMEKAAALAEYSPWNRVSGPAAGTCRLGVVASGISRAYLADALDEYGWRDKVRVLELGFSWPLPENMLVSFMNGCDTVLVLEELEDLLEAELRGLANKHGLGVTIKGKGRVLTRYGEYSVQAVATRLMALLEPDMAVHMPAHLPNLPDELPSRPPNLCAGCSHRAMYYATRKIFGDEAMYSSDIGCYTLGILPPLKAADFLFCMGSSISAGSGFAMLSGQPVVAFIGDSTFFHSGLTGLANAVFNKHNLLVVVLDNGTTAMTGHQPNPGVAQQVLGDGCAHLDIEEAVRGCGVAHVTRVKPSNLRATMKALADMKTLRGVRVVIAEEPCALFARRTLKKSSPQVAQVVVQDDSALACLAEYACPAFTRTGEGIEVDETLCTGCMVCLQISPSFKARKRD